MVAAGLTIVLSVAGCDRAASGRAKSDSGESTDGEAIAATAKSASQGAPYTTRPLEGYGKVSGFVELEGPPPPDTVFQPSVDQPVCGAAFTRRGIDRAGNRAIGVVVWIDGLRAGKPLPPDRRFEVLNQNCLMFPEVQAAIAGGTLNVRNLDAAEHRTRITRSGTGEVLATIRETDEGQVVPNEHVLVETRRAAPDVRRSLLDARLDRGVRPSVFHDDRRGTARSRSTRSRRVAIGSGYGIPGSRRSRRPSRSKRGRQRRVTLRAKRAS